jgi:rifampicin phosphotransferase
VPRGVVITSTAIKEIIQAIPSGAVDSKNLASDLKRLVDAVLLGAMAKFVNGYDSRARFAVRSSASVEDGNELSFAGQFETVLNCTKESLASAVVSCLLSTFSDRVKAYAAHGGLDKQIDMAVIVQEMVDPEISGVMFTVNPANGNSKELFVSFSEGCGTAVVDGSGKTTELVIDRSGHDQARYNEHDGEDGCQGDGALRLSPEEIEALRKAANEIESAFQYPQDIEWCLKSGALWILQARPITSVSAQWTRDETAERFPNRMTPLAWSVVQDVFHRSLGRSLQIMGLPPFKGQWFSQHDFAIFGNQSAMEFYRHVLRLKTLGPGISLTTIGELLGRLKWAEGPLHFWRSSIDDYLIRLGRTKASIDAASDAASLWSAVEELRDLAFDYFAPNIAISMGHGALFGTLSELVAWVNRSQPRTLRMEYLTAGCETKTSEFQIAVVRLAAVIRSHPSLVQVICNEDAGAALKAMRAVPGVAAAIDGFIATHGHREVDNFLDPYYPSLEERQHLIVTLVEAHLRSDARADGSFLGAEKQRYRSELATFLTLLPNEARPHVIGLVELTRRYIEIDDVEHYHTTRLQSMFRTAMTKVGKEFQAKGLLKDPLDLFFATYADVRNLKLGIEPRSILEGIAESKAKFSALEGQAVAWDLDGTLSTNGASLSGLRGVSCSSGTAQGPVFKVLSMDDMARFPRGAVLVAQAALPAWTPLFHLASAIVTEGGGPLSHAAIVAREIGIPAVMAVKGCLNSLSEGDLVDVDGARGRVQLVS